MYLFFPFALFFCIPIPFSLSFIKQDYRFVKWITTKTPETKPVLLPTDTVADKELDRKYRYQWYVVEESKNIETKKLYKIMIRDKEYVYWKYSKNEYTAMDNDCNHRGADLSKGYVRRGRVTCPYHGAEFNRKGMLCKIPGMEIENRTDLAKCFHQDSYPIMERNGWVYLNTISKSLYIPKEGEKEPVFIEPEADNAQYTCIYLQNKIHAPSRLVSENLLDVIHISFVHTFGNAADPLPMNDPIAFMKKDFANHYAIHYFYKSGKKSFVKRIFHYADLHIENEFILPHTVISRVRFGDCTKTIMTFALPNTERNTTLFMKVYRNFFYFPNAGFFGCIYNTLMDKMVTRIVKETVQEDVNMLENINIDKINGKYNVKYDRFPNMYRKMYDKIYGDGNGDGKV